MKKKILFVTTISNTIESFFIPHIHYLLSKGFAVGVATNTEDNTLERLAELGVVIHHVPFSRKIADKANLSAYKVIKKIIKPYHILHLHTPISSFITRICSSKNHKVIYTSHGFHFNEHGRWYTNFLFFSAEKLAGLKTNKLIVINHDDLVAAKRIVSKKKLHHVNGVGLDTSIYQSDQFSEQEKQGIKLELGLESDEKVITHIAEFNDNKRQMDIVHACELLKEQKTKKFTILLIGTGENMDKIQKQINDRNLQGYIKCLGLRRDIPRILSITNIGLLVSIREGLPRSLMEMMSMKIPVVATNIRGNRDLIENGVNGYLVSIKDPSQIAEKCLTLLTNENLPKQFGEKGREKIEKQFSIEKVLQQMEVVYQEMGLYKDDRNVLDQS
jgi:glycosyltransferase involved in cell wall biosynthesis